MNRRDRAGAPLRALFHEGWGGAYPTYVEPAAASDAGSWREERMRALLRRYRRQASASWSSGLLVGLAIGGGLAILGFVMGGGR